MSGEGVVRRGKEDVAAEMGEAACLCPGRSGSGERHAGTRWVFFPPLCSVWDLSHCVHIHTSVNLLWKNPPRHTQSRASLMRLGISFEKLCVMCVYCWELNPQTHKASTLPPELS